MLSAKPKEQAVKRQMIWKDKLRKVRINNLQLCSKIRKKWKMSLMKHLRSQIKSLKISHSSKKHKSMSSTWRLPTFKTNFRKNKTIFTHMNRNLRWFLKNSWLTKIISISKYKIWELTLTSRSKRPPTKMRKSTQIILSMPTKSRLSKNNTKKIETISWKKLMSLAKTRIDYKMNILLI